MQPPQLALWLNERTLAPDERDAVIGDLLEEFTSRAAVDPRAARRWVWAQTCRSAVPNLRRRLGPRSAIADPAPGARMLNGLVSDVQFTLRLLRRQPLMSLVAFVSLTAGLGLNILLLTLADAALTRPLPLRDPARLVVVLLQRESGLMHNFSYPEYQDLRDATHTLDGLVAYGSVAATMSGSEGATSVEGEVVSGNLFAVLGVPVMAGRPLGDADDRAAAPPVAVVSEPLWRDRFGGAAVAGQTMILNGQPFTIVGVAGGRFSGMQVGRRAEFWVPLAHSRFLTGEDYLGRRTTSWLTIVGRLRMGTADAPAREELDAILRRVRESTGAPIEPVVFQPGARGDSMLSEQLASPLTLLLAAGALVLLVACLNVANLQLARTEARRRELAVRSALGARRFQLVRLVVIDGFLMAIAAGGAGVWLAALFKDRAAGLIALYGQPVSLSIPLDGRIAAAALALSLGAALIIGVLSTWQMLRRQVPGGLTDGRGEGRSRRPVQRALVVAQVALSMGLLTGASLLVRTLDRLRHADLGFDPRGIAVLQVSPEKAGLSRAVAGAYFDRAIREVTALPGVQGAAVAHVMPLDFGGSRTTISIAGYTPAPDEEMQINFVRISPGYFHTLGLPVREGRPFDERDRDGQPERVIVNETMAKRFWPDGRAVGRFVRFSSSVPFNVEVIGVVPDAHYRMVREPSMPTFYVPLAQWPSAEGVLHVRLAGDPSGRISELRRAVAGVDPAVPVTRAYTLFHQLERNIADERMAMAIGSTMALVALLLATAGLYATMAFLVGRRTREIGVRMALGARTTDVRSLVLREGLALTVAGIAAGLAISAWVGHALRHQLYGIGPFDATSIAAAAAVLAAAALLGSWLPARRAARVDPITALRES
jgi:macrolide transport system ATP-binding/permease protein